MNVLIALLPRKIATARKEVPGLANLPMPAKDWQPSVYLKWDNTEHRLTIQKRQWQTNPKLIVFDELHKLKKGKT